MWQEFNFHLRHFIFLKLHYFIQNKARPFYFLEYHTRLTEKDCVFTKKGKKKKQKGKHQEGFVNTQWQNAHFWVSSKITDKIIIDLPCYFVKLHKSKIKLSL